MKYAFAALGLFLSVVKAEPAFVKPIPLALNKRPGVEKYLLQQIADQGDFKAIVNASLYDLRMNCGGEKIYALSFFNLKAKDRMGKVVDVSADFTGSGGTRVVLASLNSDGRPNKVLFDEVLMDWWGALDASECAQIKVHRRGLNKDGVMEEGPAVLKFIKGKYRLETVGT